jgi:hypothetical protein
MPDLFPEIRLIPEINPGRRLEAKVAGLYVATSGHFRTRAVEEVQLGFDGIAGDIHAGFTRRSGGREPWYPRDTEIRNERQVSLVAPDELASIADHMALQEIRPEWIGANFLIEGLPQFSMLPAGTLMFFEGGATLKIEGQNHPCRFSGRSIAEMADMPDKAGAALSFVKAAKRLRGLVAWVEKPGTVKAGEQISVRVPEQWIYRPGQEISRE